MNSRVAVFGKLVCDEVLLLPSHLSRGQQQTVEHKRSAGGAPANVTSWLTTCGVKARFCGLAGADPIADALLEDLAESGVEQFLVRRGDTVTAVVLVEPDGQRTLLSYPGDVLHPNDIEGSWFEETNHLHLDGYDLLPEGFPDALKTAADLAHHAGISVSLDLPSAERIETFGTDAFRNLVSNLSLSVLFCNEDEAAVLDVANHHLASITVVHQGENPTVVYSGAESNSYPVAKLEAIDTTGAGDAFAAGFLAGYLQTRDISRAIQLAHYTAGKSVLNVGGQPPMREQFGQSL